MKLSDAQIEQTLNQIEAEAIPADHPAVEKLESLFGSHTFFLDGNGLNIVEPMAKDDADSPSCVVMNLADWSDGSATALRPHAPEPTELMVYLEARPN